MVDSCGMGNVVANYRSRTPVWALLAITVLGCSPFISPKPKAAQTLGCPEEQLEVESNSTYSDVVTGCGKSDVIVQESGSKVSSLRDRAAFELSCDNAEIEVTILSSSIYGVSGCGQRVVYKYVPYVGIVSDTVAETQSPETQSPETQSSVAPNASADP